MILTSLWHLATVLLLSLSLFINLYLIGSILLRGKLQTDEFKTGVAAVSAFLLTVLIVKCKLPQHPALAIVIYTFITGLSIGILKEIKRQKNNRITQRQESATRLYQLAKNKTNRIIAVAAGLLMWIGISFFVVWLLIEFAKLALDTDLLFK